jgi:hypothetical protein
MVPITGRGRRVLLAVLSLLLLVGGSYVATPRASADESTKVLLLLDVSGSMNERISMPIPTLHHHLKAAQTSVALPEALMRVKTPVVRSIVYTILPPEY